MSKHPQWLVKRAPDPSVIVKMKELADRLRLHTICESAGCPNQGECFSKGTATFLILGDVCTRNCTFCAVNKGVPSPLDPEEPNNIGQATKELNLQHVVITSVTRDDLPDGGAEHFSRTIEAIKSAKPDTTVEVLIPDFKGSIRALEIVIHASPEIINHNLETVPRLYSEVRPLADYDRSLRLLQTIKELNSKMLTKSGLMLGLGENSDEVIDVITDLHNVNCDLLTVGQYLQPSAQHHEVVRYVPPEEFRQHENTARSMGFTSVAAAPYVRSSFNAEETYNKVKQLKRGL